MWRWQIAGSCCRKNLLEPVQVLQQSHQTAPTHQFISFFFDSNDTEALEGLVVIWTFMECRYSTFIVRSQSWWNYLIFCPIFAALYFWFMEELIQQTGARHVDADSHCSEELCKSVQIANDTLFKGGVQPEYVGCSLHHYAVCGVVRELHCASLCTALCNTARRPAADSAESCDAPFVNIHQQPPSSPMCTTLL